jgi:hypothetical protein
VRAGGGVGTDPDFDLGLCCSCEVPDDGIESAWDIFLTDAGRRVGGGGGALAVD